SVKRLAETAIEEFGHIDTLINVAGVNRRMPAEEYTEADYDFIVDINLKGAFLLSQAVGRHMLARGHGNQINIVSLNNYAPLKHVLPYAVSKAGLGQMTRALALEWGPRGVRVNASHRASSSPTSPKPSGPAPTCKPGDWPTRPC